MRVKVQQMAKQGQCDAQNVLDILATAFEKDQHASGGVTVDKEDNLISSFVLPVWAYC